MQSLLGEVNRDGDRILWPLFGAAALVLLIACGNTASLMLVRGLQRQQEYAGAHRPGGQARRELFWQASVENLIIALGGGLLGVSAAFGITKVFKLIGGHAIPRLDSVTANWPILACGFRGGGFLGGAGRTHSGLAGFASRFR